MTSASLRLFALAAICSGCTVLSPAKVEINRAVLSEIPLELPEEKTRPATLLILAPEARPVYDTTQMAYSVQPYQLAYFSHNEWAEKPAQMILPLLVQTLQNTRYFSAVLTPPAAGRYTYALRSEILELKQDFTSDAGTLELVMRFQLSRQTPSQIIATKEISVREPMLEKTPYAGVVAANHATAKALRELARFVLETIG